MEKRLPQWPGMVERGPRVRTLAMLDGHYLCTPGMDYQVESWGEIKSLAFTSRPLLEIYVTDLAGSWWFDEAVRDPAVRLTVPTSAGIHSWSMVTCLMVKGDHNKRAWIISTRAWGTAAVTPSVLAGLTALFEQSGVGVRPTPGSLGQAIMRKLWQEEDRSWVSRPPNQCRADLLQHCIGGRVDYFVSPKDRFERVFETDLTSAYASVLDGLPDGSTIGLHAEPGLECATWFMRCRVDIPDGPLTPFGIFGVKGAAENTYPVMPGEYDVWLWKEEADLCRRNHWLVQPSSGWGWPTFNAGLAPWARHMYQLRVTAGRSDSARGQWMKQAIVSALGRFGMPLWTWIVLPESSPLVTDGDQALMNGTTETGWVLHRQEDTESNSLSHWYSYILMRTRLVLRARMQFEHDRGNRVLATNYDSLYCLLPADPASLGPGLGDWKTAVLTGVRFPFSRGVVSREKTTLPGVVR
jgi:hypothetical protein